jgi:hypothetical protein
MVQIIQQCLKNSIRERPSTQQVMELLEEARAEIDDCGFNVNKLSLVQLLQSRNLHIQQRQQKYHSLKDRMSVQKAQIKSLEEQVETLKTQKSSLKRSNKVGYFTFIQ